MSRYWCLSFDSDAPQPWNLGEAHYPDGQEYWSGMYAVRSTRRLAPGERMTVEVTHPGRRLDFWVSSFGVPVATRVFGEAIVSVAGDDVELLPASAGHEHDMVVLHPRRAIRCVDQTRSKFTLFLENDPVRPDLAGEYSWIIKLVLDRSSIPADAHSFIVHGSSKVIVSERMRDAILGGPHVGVRLTEVEVA